jgi:hypothetical protein
MSATVRRRPVVAAGLVLVAAAVLAAAAWLPSASAAFDDATLDANAARVQRAARRARVIFVGSVTAVGERPIYWSGYTRADQTVNYAVDHVVKGSLAVSTIGVQHAVVGGSRNADASGPGLSPSRFAVGQKLIVGVSERNGRFFDLDESYGTLTYSAANERALVTLMPYEVAVPLSSRNGAANR